MIATVEATATASKNYAVGDLLVYDGKLYKVTSAIATGATIIAGSNVTQTTVETQIASAGGGGGGGGETWYTAELSEVNWDSTNHMFLFDAGNGNKIKQAQILGQIVNDGLQTEPAKLLIGFGNSVSDEVDSVPASFSDIATTMRRTSFSAKIEMTEFQANNQLIRCANAYYFRAGYSGNAVHSLNVDTQMKLGDTRATNFYWNYNDPRYLKIVIPQWTAEWAYIRISYTLM